MSKRIAILKYETRFSSSGRIAFAACILAVAAFTALPAFSADKDKDFEKGDFAMEEGDMETAVRFFARAAENGHAEAANRLGVIKHNDKQYEEAFKLFKQAAELEFKPAIMNLAQYYSIGLGCEVNYKEAFKLYMKLAEDDDAEAQLIVGVHYFNGTGVDPNDEEAVKWFRIASDHGNLQAQVNLGKCFLWGRGVPEDKKEAFELFSQASQKGDSMAKYMLGTCYLYGHGTSKSEILASIFFHDSIDLIRMQLEGKDDSQSRDLQFHLGLGYYRSFSVLYDKLHDEIVKDYEQSRDFYTPATPFYASTIKEKQNELKTALSYIPKEQERVTGYIPAISLYEIRKALDDCKEAVHWFTLSAENGNPLAQYKMASAICERPNEKITYYKKAAEQGLVEAQRELGELYLNLDKPDLFEAKKWYGKAAEQGDILSQYALACIFRDNEKNDAEAFKWFHELAESPLRIADGRLFGPNEVIIAQYNLARCYATGKGVEDDEEIAFKWYEKVAGYQTAALSYEAKKASSCAKYNLAVCYERGWGVEKNIGEAIKWYKMTVEQESGDNDSVRKASAALKRLGQQ